MMFLQPISTNRVREKKPKRKTTYAKILVEEKMIHRKVYESNTTSCRYKTFRKIISGSRQHKQLVTRKNTTKIRIKRETEIRSQLST